MQGRDLRPRVRTRKKYHADVHKATPRFVSEVPPDAPLWLRLHHVADRHIPEFQSAMSEYRDSLLAALPLADLTNALSTSDPYGTMEALLARLQLVEVGKAVLADDPLEGISATYRNIILGGAKEALSLEPEVLRRLPFVQNSLTLTNRYAVQYAQTMGSTLIRQVNAQTIEAVRAIVGAALRSSTSLSPVQQAKLIREVVGLTARQAAQVARYHASLKGSPASIEKRVKALADRLHRRRSITIARTETIRASNAGVRMLGDEMRALPFMRETDFRYVWITTPDDRLCPRCSDLHNQVVGYDENFSEGASPQVRAPFVGRNPPLHPMCRCAIARKVESIEELEQRIANYTPPSAGLTRAQKEALAPAKRYNKDLRKQTEAALRETPEGALLADVLNDFQHAEAVKGLRAGITKELANPGSGGERSRTLLAAMRNADDTDEVLWRGMRVKTSQKGVLAQYAEGEVFDMNLSSFSTSPGVAQVFAEGAGSGGTRVIIGVVGRKRGALPIQNLAKNSSVFSEKELIMGGKFRVIGSEKQGNNIVISLQQIGAL